MQGMSDAATHEEYIGVRIFGSDWLVGAVQEGMTPPR